MNKLTTIVATGLLLGACSWATASPILFSNGATLTIGGDGNSTESAQTAEKAFQESLQGGYLFENFESFTAAKDSTGQTLDPFETDVGTFQTNDGETGVGGACNDSGFQCDQGLAVLDETETPFKGRFAVSGDNWLDSMDAQELTISPKSGHNAIGFFMTDPNDAKGRFSIDGDEFSFANIFGEGLDNGRVFYISIFSAHGLGDITIHSNRKNDGYGLDDITLGIVAVPEPGTLALLGIGLVGLILARKRKQS